MKLKVLHRYLSGAAFTLSASLNGLAVSALMLAVLPASLPPAAKSLIYSKEGKAFLAASWGERGLLHDVIFLPRKETARRRLLVRVLDELQTPAGQEFVAAGLRFAQRPELESELAQAQTELKKTIRTLLRDDAKARAAAAEFQTYGRPLANIIDTYIDNAIHDLTQAHGEYPALVSGSGETSRDRPLEPIGAILDRFFDRYPLPDLEFVKTPPDQDAEAAIAALNDKALSKQITALNFRKTVAPPGGLKVSFEIDGQDTEGVISVGGFEFLREIEANERCFVGRYRSANGYPVVLSYERGADLIAAPACLSTDLIAGTMAGPLNSHRITIVRVPFLGRFRPNLADKETRKAVFASTAAKLGGALWVLPPQTGGKFLAMLQRLFPSAMQEIAPRLPGPDESVWTLTRGRIIDAGKASS